MMSARRSTAKAKPRQHSMRRQRLRHGSHSCCGEKIYSRIEELLNLNQEFPASQSCETVFNKFLLKFSQCRPRVQSVKSRLRESFELLSEIDELLDFFCDPQRLWAYLLEEKPQAHIEATSQSLPSETRTSSENVAPQRRDSSKAISCESYCSRKPEVDTITEEGEESPPMPAGPDQTKLSGGRGEEATPRVATLLSHVSQQQSSEKQTPESASFAMPRYDRSDVFTTVALNRFSKRFKTSTPAEHSPSMRLSPPRMSLISHHQVQCGRQRRKAMMIEPPEENGAWMGTPVIRNQPGSTQVQMNNGEHLRMLSLSSTAKGNAEASPKNKDSVASELVPINPPRAESQNLSNKDGEEFPREESDPGQENRSSEGKTERLTTATTERPRRNARINVVTRAQTKKELDVDINVLKTIEASLPSSTVGENKLPYKRPLRKAAAAVCRNEPSCKKKRK